MILIKDTSSGGGNTSSTKANDSNSKEETTEKKLELLCRQFGSDIVDEGMDLAESKHSKRLQNRKDESTKSMQVNNLLIVGSFTPLRLLINKLLIPRDLDKYTYRHMLTRLDWLETDEGDLHGQNCS